MLVKGRPDLFRNAGKTAGIPAAKGKGSLRQADRNKPQKPAARLLKDQSGRVFFGLWLLESAFAAPPAACLFFTFRYRKEKSDSTGVLELKS